MTSTCSTTSINEKLSTFFKQLPTQNSNVLCRMYSTPPPIMQMQVILCTKITKIFVSFKDVMKILFMFVCVWSSIRHKSLFSQFYILNIVIGSTSKMALLAFDWYYLILLLISSYIFVYAQRSINDAHVALISTRNINFTINEIQL